MSKPIDPKVRLFAKVLCDILEKDNWGQIEPEVFKNIGLGITQGEDLWCDKYDMDEMEDAVPAMAEAIRMALDAIGAK